ncbi:MAG: DUF1353 domain-containing protein [Casimicrobiaceae bacterium]
MRKLPLPRFEGQVNATWLRQPGPDRDMRLTTDFAFVDSRGVRWEAPAGRVVDGASIPDALWSSLIGTPYIGDYRRATVVHDIACRDRVRPYEEVHYMLYEAMLCDGVTPDREALMYTALRLFGPKWRRAQARQRTQAALRDFDPRELARTLDHALHERTRWRRTA